MEAGWHCGKQLKIYLDTCIINFNFLFADDAPLLRDVTIDFFENSVKMGKYEVYISDIVVAEIEATNNLEKRTKRLNVLTAYPIRFVTEGRSPEIVSIVSSTAALGDKRIRRICGFIRLSPKAAVLDLMIFN